METHIIHITPVTSPHKGFGYKIELDGCEENLEMFESREEVSDNLERLLIEVVESIAHYTNATDINLSWTEKEKEIQLD